MVLEEIKIFALPFHKKKKREIVFNHRPVMTEGAHIENMARMKIIPYGCISIVGGVFQFKIQIC